MLTLLYETLRERYLSGILDPPLIEDHQIGDLVGVLNPVIQTRLENTRSKRSR